MIVRKPVGVLILTVHDSFLQNSEKIIEALKNNEFVVKGRFIYSSNYTFLAQIAIEGQEHPLQAVYKPTQGERPLWDFPEDTLAHREAAAYLVSHHIGWNIVPPTCYRENGPFGSGSLQLFIPHDPDHHYFNFNEREREQLKPVVILDILVNNADRKGGHTIVDQEGKVWCIDHGICFHREEKMRTVIWEFAGKPIPLQIRKDLHKFTSLLDDDTYLCSLGEHLSREEILALKERAKRLSQLRRYPAPAKNRRIIPWPPV